MTFGLYFVNIQEYIKKLRALPEPKKKVVFISVMTVSVLIIGFWGIISTKNGIEKIGQSATLINFPEEIDISDSQINTPDVEINDTTPNEPENIFQDQNVDTVTPPSTDNWQKYTNDTYGYEIKYPLNVSIKENTSHSSFMYAQFEDGDLYPFWIYSGNSNNKNVINTIHPESSDYTEIKNGTLSINTITWNTIEKINIPAEGAGTASSSLIFYTQKEDATYMVECVNCNADIFGVDGTNKKSIFDQMVSTFKFAT